MEWIGMEKYQIEWNQKGNVMGIGMVIWIRRQGEGEGSRVGNKSSEKWDRKFLVEQALDDQCAPGIKWPIKAKW